MLQLAVENGAKLLHDVPKGTGGNKSSKVYSKLDRGIQSATEMLPLVERGVTVLHIAVWPVLRFANAFVVVVGGYGDAVLAGAGFFAASPSLTYSRLANNHANISTSFHPYRRWFHQPSPRQWPSIHTTSHATIAAAAEDEDEDEDDEDVSLSDTVVMLHLCLCQSCYFCIATVEYYLLFSVTLPLSASQCDCLSYVDVSRGRGLLFNSRHFSRMLRTELSRCQYLLKLTQLSVCVIWADGWSLVIRLIISDTLLCCWVMMIGLVSSRELPMFFTRNQSVAQLCLVQSTQKLFHCHLR